MHEAWKWYRKHFSMDILMFDEEAVAELMLAHTDGKPRARHAILALNMEGGGGFEIWQHTDKKPSSNCYSNSIRRFRNKYWGFEN